MKRSKSYYFRENGWAIWLTASQYWSLLAGFEKRASTGDAVARRRIKGFGPPPVAETHETQPAK